MVRRLGDERWAFKYSVSMKIYETTVRDVNVRLPFFQKKWVISDFSALIIEFFSSFGAVPVQSGKSSRAFRVGFGAGLGWVRA